MSNLKKYYSFLILVVFSITSVNVMYSQPPEDVRAMMIFTIAPGITWENEENISKYTIGVFSSEKEYTALKKLAKTRSINRKPVEVIRYEKYEDVKPNHIVYVTKNENSRLGFIFNKLAGKNVLIISDRSKYVGLSVVNLNKIGANQPFTISAGLYKKQRLKFSLALLRLGGDRQELKKIQAETNRKLLFEKKALENKKIEIAKTNKELKKAKRDLKIKDKEIEILKGKLRKCEEQK